MPFSPYDPTELQEHFERHGQEFSAANQIDYEQMADAFWARVVNPPLHECMRTNGMKCRYDTQTEEYSVLAKWGWVVTYFIPVPCSRMIVENCHGFASNWEYFEDSCH